MNDHNLDDLIIDTPSQKGGKAKGFLTIIALFIVVLIVAIILTKIILKDPDADRAVLVENETEMISPELTLQSGSETPNDDEKALSEMIESEVIAEEEVEAPKAAVEEISKETVAIEEKAVKDTPVKEAPEVVTPTVKKPAEPKKESVSAEEPKKKEIVKIPVTKPTPKPVVASKPKTKPAPVKTVHETFYIQVGSFSKTPSSSSRLITAIRKQGFHYKIATIGGMKKVLIGPYPSRPAVDKALVRVRDLINKSAFVVKK